jgi:hypothetical protein
LVWLFILLPAAYVSPLSFIIETDKLDEAGLSWWPPRSSYFHFMGNHL